MINGELVASSPLVGMIRVALVPNANVSNGDNEDVLNRHAYAFAKQAEVEFVVEGDTAKMKYCWDKEGFGDLVWTSCHDDAHNTAQHNYIRGFSALNQPDFQSRES